VRAFLKNTIQREVVEAIGVSETRSKETVQLQVSKVVRREVKNTMQRELMNAVNEKVTCIVQQQVTVIVWEQITAISEQQLPGVQLSSRNPSHADVARTPPVSHSGNLSNHRRDSKPCEASERISKPRDLRVGSCEPDLRIRTEGEAISAAVYRRSFIPPK
jgi:hypothetical protein